MTGILPFETLIDIVRVEIYEALTLDGLDWIDAVQVAESIDEAVTASYVRLVFRQLAADQEIYFETTSHPLRGEVKTERVSITSKGIKKVERILQDDSSFLSAYQRGGLDNVDICYIGLSAAPAADRIVTYDHNQAAADQARELIKELKEDLRKSNDLSSDLAEIKQIALREVDALDFLLNESAVRVASVVGLARQVLPWIAEKAGAATIAELAKQALSAIIKWLC